MVDLILQARNLWGCENMPYTSISMEVNNRTSMSITIYEKINTKHEKITHYYMEPHDFIANAVTDPNFYKAEAHIRRLLKEEE